MHRAPRRLVTIRRLLRRLKQLGQRGYANSVCFVIQRKAFLTRIQRFGDEAFPCLPNDGMTEQSFFISYMLRNACAMPLSRT